MEREKGREIQGEREREGRERERERQRETERERERERSRERESELEQAKQRDQRASTPTVYSHHSDPRAGQAVFRFKICFRFLPVVPLTLAMSFISFFFTLFSLRSFCLCYGFLHNHQATCEEG